MPPDIYLDHNALIYHHEKTLSDSAFNAKLLQAVTGNTFRIVLSPWHWVEAARDKNPQRASQRANFMDALNPIWLRDRRDLERIEVENGFFVYLNVPHTPASALITRVELLSALNNMKLDNATAPSSQNFVDGWIKKPQLMEPIVQSQKKNAQAVVNLREAIASGTLTAAHKKEGDRKLIEGFLPAATPNGIVVDASTKNAYLDSVTPQVFPTLAIEAAIAEYTWRTEGRTGWNSMVDRFHMNSALPYVDIIVSDDGYFYTLLPVASSTGFVKASVVKFADFCHQFLS